MCFRHLRLSFFHWMTLECFIYPFLPFGFQPYIDLRLHNLLVACSWWEEGVQDTCMVAGTEVILPMTTRIVLSQRLKVIQDRLVMDGCTPIRGWVSQQAKCPAARFWRGLVPWNSSDAPEWQRRYLSVLLRARSFNTGTSGADLSTSQWWFAHTGS